MSSSDVAISVENVGKCYKIYRDPKDRLKQAFARGGKKYFKEFWALKGVSFEVKKGETVGIIGKNGSGKSTLLQIIAGTLTATEGFVNVKGRIAALLELGSGFNFEFTGKENVYLNGSILGVSQEEMEKRFAGICAFADIGDFIDQPVKTYSSGMFVRLAFAVQALIEPEVLIVDEALSVGDEKFQRRCFSYIEKLRENGTAILVVSHSTSMIEKFTNKCMLLEKGVLHGFGRSNQIIDQYHALLYADEAAYLKILNNGQVDIVTENTTEVSNNNMSNTSSCDGLESRQRAIIETVRALNINGAECGIYTVGEILRIEFKVRFFEEIATVQAGIRLKTVEGVEAYGVSTENVGENISNVKKGSSCAFTFVLPMDLCEGTYFISVAIAEKVSPSEMRYLDKKSDVLIIKLKEKKITATGIAHLKATVEYLLVEA